jgi:hypothetical protein
MRAAQESAADQTGGDADAELSVADDATVAAAEISQREELMASGA